MSSRPHIAIEVSNPKHTGCCPALAVPWALGRRNRGQFEANGSVERTLVTFALKGRAKENMHRAGFMVG
jgi:hypothetical protein